MSKSYTLWSGEKFEVITLQNPHIPVQEGFHLLITLKERVPSAWTNPALCGEAFELSARVCQVMEKLELAPWFNLQANGNWGLLPNSTPHFHVHIYARRKGKTWGMPVQLPLAPNTYNNEPMSDGEREKLSEVLLEFL